MNEPTTPEAAAMTAARLLPTFGRPLTSKEVYRLLPPDNPAIATVLGAANATTLLNRAFERLQDDGLVIGEKTGRSRFDPLRWTWIGPVILDVAESAEEDPSDVTQPSEEPLPAVVASPPADPIDEHLEAALSAVRRLAVQSRRKNDITARVALLVSESGEIADRLLALCENLIALHDELERSK